MKVKFFLLPLLAIGSSVISHALASGYPAHYCHQVVRVVHDGPVLLAHVGSGCDQAEVVGYKPSGFLAGRNPASIEATFVARCQGNGETHEKITRIQLGREWHGVGYLSAPFIYSNLVPFGCNQSDPSSISVGVAFSADGQWDSQFGANYRHPGYGFYGRTDVVSYETGASGFGSMNLAAWDFIVGQMRQ